MEMLEHLVKAREHGEAGPDGQRASARRKEDIAKRNNGLEVGLPSRNTIWVELAEGASLVLLHSTSLGFQRRILAPNIQQITTLARCWSLLQFAWTWEYCQRRCFHVRYSLLQLVDNNPV